MKWLKQGLIFEPPANLDWMATHAALPVADLLDTDRYRVYFSGRDNKGRAQIGFFEIDITDPKIILKVSPKPVVALGLLGTFDDNGVTSSCIVNYQGKKYLYFTGWNLGVTVPFYFFAGLAISNKDEHHYTKISKTPILDRNIVDPFLTASPYVIIEGGLWRMWYVSCLKWELRSDGPMHYYHIRYAESDDGIHWRRDGIVCIDFASENEYAIARPCVIRDKDIYRMWYSYRGERYRIGYAESVDGIRWERKDGAVGIDISETGWDSDMIEYPFVFDHGGNRYMLYNGNGYGRTGIGLAILTRDD